MQPLLDGDILLYEVAFKSQSKKDDGSIFVFPWETAMKHMDRAIDNICAECYATEPPIIYLTGKGNFRDEIATEKKYKGNRKKEKPFHYYNLRAYLEGAYDTRCVDGLEADDLLCIEQQKRLSDLDTIICSRDKDLRIQPGYHFTWEVNGQPRFGPALVREVGELKLKRGGKKLFGTGLSFFYSQLLTGDATDNIPKVASYGPVKTFKTLAGHTTHLDLFKAVRDVYREFYGDEWDVKMLERGRLLWMTKELHEDGSPVLWELPFKEEELGESREDSE